MAHFKVVFKGSNLIIYHLEQIIIEITASILIKQTEGKKAWRTMQGRFLWTVLKVTELTGNYISWQNVILLLKIFMYLFGCIGFQLWRTGSSLCHCEIFYCNAQISQLWPLGRCMKGLRVVAHGFQSVSSSSLDLQALQLQHVGSVVLRHVGS